ncbi:sensor domain-containing diguanylate cyclase [Cellulosilyticum sp. I15G10I2]|uniref:sensor domain-containing diguanylate cyclase n=1 Tax=Cellulosilyticum sp. I15G10I2 TaxID=1892843 RepID=UPI00085CB6C3|nr:sensor domain-containing diguanylate cyclase [Cellulosilyticum sp. I15G10I2]
MDPQVFEKYQMFTEKTIFDLSQQVIMLEKKLNVFTNLLEISKYINQYIKDQNLFSLINDMLIGVFGAKYSTIYIKSNNEYIETTPKTFSYSSIEEEKKLILDHLEEEFIINSNKPIYETQNAEESVFSCLGVPIKVDNRAVGFILIQHKEKDYFSKDHATFLSSLANHVGVAIENNLLYTQIKESAYRDGLTGIFNKRYFFETLEAIPHLDEQNYTLVMIDLDNFKVINDTYGHPYGDAVLKKVSSIIKSGTRPNDIVARYGGEEMIIFFYNFTDKTKVFQRVEAIRREIEKTVIRDEGISSSVTASFGVYVKVDESLSLNDVLKKADENLYVCKRTGKNKVILNF